MRSVVGLDDISECDDELVEYEMTHWNRREDLGNMPLKNFKLIETRPAPHFL
jgi:hypothetical protein